MNYFLKSDYGKTPKYIFKFNKDNDLPKLPNKDQFLKNTSFYKKNLTGLTTE